MRTQRARGHCLLAADSPVLRRRRGQPINRRPTHRETSMATEYSDIQVMMTLAAFAATATTPLPGGVETVGQQQQRMLANINQQLSNAGIATAGSWQAVWVGLTEDRANMSYIAQNSQTNQYAVSVRGTVPADVNNWAEDLDVGVVLAFTEAGSTPLMVSQGALQAFNAVTAAVFLP